MSIRFENEMAVFDNICNMTEAEDFLQWLAATKEPKLDLSGCKHLHTSILQLIVSFKPTIVSYPTDKVMAAWIKNND